MKKQLGEEHGMIMLEGTICILFSLVAALVILSLSFYLYQCTLVRVVADEIAENAAVTYKYLEADSVEELTLADIQGLGLFRYTDLNKGEYAAASEEKAEKVANRHLSTATMAFTDTTPTVTVSQIADDIGRYHYAITVTQEYTFFFGGLLEFLGLDAKQEITAVSYARGVDVSHYCNAVRTAQYLFGGHTDLGKAVDSCIKAIHSLKKLGNTLFGGGDASSTDGGAGGGSGGTVSAGGGSGGSAGGGSR